MKVNIETDQALLETEVLIRCAAHDERIDSIIAALHRCERRIAASYDGAMYPVAPSDIFYIETVDGSTFAYAKDRVHAMPFRIHELEEALYEYGFRRISKSSLLNLCRIRCLAPYVGARLLASLDNGEDIVISRKYAKNIKRELCA